MRFGFHMVYCIGPESEHCLVSPAELIVEESERAPIPDDGGIEATFYGMVGLGFELWLGLGLDSSIIRNKG